MADQANTPGALFDGEYVRVYFCRGVNVVVARSKDGAKWEEKAVQVSGLSNSMIALDPEVVHLPDGKYRMYYYEHPLAKGKPLSIPGTFTIASAISDDGFSFAKEPGVRFQYERVMDPDVVQIGDRWRMFASQDGKTVSAVSHDNGLSFAFESYLSLDSWVTSTIEVPGGYRMYYHAQETPPRIYSAFSPDGVTWTKDQGLRIGEGPAGSPDAGGAGSMAAVRANGMYWLVYAVRQGDFEGWE